MRKEEILKNEIIMNFLIEEALEKTASDIRAKSGSGTTAKAVKLMMPRNDEVANRVMQYVAVGVDAVSEMEVV